MIADLESRYMPEPNSGCWIWLGSTRKANYEGYGIIWIDQKHLYAHRVVYELLKGPILDGLELDHLCRNTLCVNPDHLEAVPHIINMRRGKPATKLFCAKGHPLSGDNLLNSKTRLRRCRTCHSENMRKYKREKRR